MANPVLGSDVPQTLAATVAGPWFDFRSGAGGSLVLSVVVAGGGVAVIDVAGDRSQIKSDIVSAVQTFSTSQAVVLQGALPNFARIRNSSGTGTVTYTFHRGLNAKNEPVQFAPQSTDPTRTGDFSS